MTKVIGWKIVYDDFSVWSSKHNAPEDVPVDGTQWILEFLDTGGKRNVHGMDNYMWTGDSWAGGNNGDLKGWLRLRDKVPLVLYGRWMSEKEYDIVREIVQGLEYDG